MNRILICVHTIDKGSTTGPKVHTDGAHSDTEPIALMRVKKRVKKRKASKNSTQTKKKPSKARRLNTMFSDSDSSDSDDEPIGRLKTKVSKNSTQTNSKTNSKIANEQAAGRDSSSPTLTLPDSSDSDDEPIGRLKTKVSKNSTQTNSKTNSKIANEQAAGSDSSSPTFTIPGSPPVGSDDETKTSAPLPFSFDEEFDDSILQGVPEELLNNGVAAEPKPKPNPLAAALNPSCSWFQCHSVELLNRCKPDHLLLAADWGVGRTNDDGRTIMGNTFRRYVDGAADVGPTYDDYLQSAQREDDLFRRELPATSVLQIVLQGGKPMVFPMFCYTNHFTAIAICPKRKTAGYFDGLYPDDPFVDTWLPHFKAAIAAIGDDWNDWKIELKLGCTRNGDVLQQDNIELLGDKRGVDYKNTDSPATAAFQCGVHVHVFADLFIDWCQLPEPAPSLQEYLWQRQESVGIVTSTGALRREEAQRFFRKARISLVDIAGRHAQMPVTRPAGPPRLFVSGHGTELKPDVEECAAHSPRAANSPADAATTPLNDGSAVAEVAQHVNPGQHPTGAETESRIQNDTQQKLNDFETLKPYVRKAETLRAELEKVPAAMAQLQCMFCFVLFCFVLFCFVLFCFVLFCFVLFCFVLFCF
eukprot:SAG31_NODE_4829_length_2920_cov_211.312655_2_plen_641_part_01